MVAHGRTVEEVAEHLGADSLAYLSLAGVYEAIRGDRERPLRRLLLRRLPAQGHRRGAGQVRARGHAADGAVAGSRLTAPRDGRRDADRARGGRSQMAFYRALGSAAPGSHVASQVRRACRRPSSRPPRTRSLPNAVALHRPARACSTRYEELADALRARRRPRLDRLGRVRATTSSSPGSSARGHVARRQPGDHGAPRSTSSTSRRRRRARPRPGPRLARRSARSTTRAYGLPPAIARRAARRHARPGAARCSSRGWTAARSRAWRSLDGPDGDCAARASSRRCRRRGAAACAAS